MDFIEQIVGAKMASIEALGRTPSGHPFGVLITHPMALSSLEVFKNFSGRDRRRIKRELRKARERVKAGEYQFKEPPPNAMVFQLDGSGSSESSAPTSSASLRSPSLRDLYPEPEWTFLSGDEIAAELENPSWPHFRGRPTSKE